MLFFEARERKLTRRGAADIIDGVSDSFGWADGRIEWFDFRADGRIEWFDFRADGRNECFDVRTFDDDVEPLSDISLGDGGGGGGSGGGGSGLREKRRGKRMIPRPSRPMMRP